MSDIRKSNPREYDPSLSGGTQHVSGGSATDKIASKDSLIGSPTNHEYKPGPLPKGGGTMGGKAKPC